MHWIRIDWSKLFSYGEVICFVSAWAVCLLMTVATERPHADQTARRNMIIAGDVAGIQAHYTTESRR